MDDALSALNRRVGRYEGHGIDHQDQPFHGELAIESLVERAAIGIHYQATAIDGSRLYDERTWIGQTPEGGLALWTIRSNASVVLRHDLVQRQRTTTSEHLLLFRFGNPDDRTVARAEVTLDLLRDGRIGYGHRSGTAGEPLSQPSRVSLQLCQDPAPPDPRR